MAGASGPGWRCWRASGLSVFDSTGCDAFRMWAVRFRDSLGECLARYWGEAFGDGAASAGLLEFSDIVVSGGREGCNVCGHVF